MAEIFDEVKTAIEEMRENDSAFELFEENGITLDDETIWMLILLSFAIPETAKESLLYKKTIAFNKDIKYLEVRDYVENFDYKNKKTALEFISAYKSKSKTDEYIKSVIDNKGMRIREKVLVILVHFERLLYETSKISKTKDGIKKDMENLTGGDLKIGSYSFSVVVMFGIAKIVFANTRDFEESIDKNIPFRNNILHNGIVDYNDIEIKNLYELLLIFVSELFLFKSREKRKQKKKDDTVYF